MTHPLANIGVEIEMWLDSTEITINCKRREIADLRDFPRLRLR
jgi:hypothetical protein